MKISARNQLSGVITEVKDGAVNGVVTIDLGGPRIKADITMESIKDLGLTVGTPAFAVIKATSVMFAAGTEHLPLSARNQFAGKVINVREGAVNGHVTIETPEGIRISGSITNEAINELGLVEGTDALAVIKSTDVMVGVEH